MCVLTSCPPAAVWECTDWLDLQERVGSVVMAVVMILVVAHLLGRCCSVALSTVMYSRFVLSSKAITWPLTAEQHPSLFRCESPAQAGSPACSARTAQPCPCMNCKAQSVSSWRHQHLHTAQVSEGRASARGKTTWIRVDGSCGISILSRGAKSALASMSMVVGSAWHTDELFPGVALSTTVIPQ